ncbi:pirin family protein [uncultured Microbacterium sp.]|uniref:pirin family protein n=1 Tax=uncultured Microbacterium sp. TaxID=191216 RepID=UPI0025D12E02|nr:pirin family protein [uncultured Microbacterium sp.]
MSRLDAGAEDLFPAAVCDGPRALMLEAREVPLGGVRAMHVRRMLPQRALPTVGAWCFLDRFGPQETVMRVEPHPHIGLQTVTWPYVGEVRHRDRLGSDVVIARGELNLMTSGDGISHSEYSLGDSPTPIDALQLWVALPDGVRVGAAAFERHTDLPGGTLTDASGRAVGSFTVVMGELDGIRSPATTFTPIVGGEIVLEAGADVRVPLRAEWEHAILAVYGEAAVTAGPAGERVRIAGDHLLYLGTGRTEIAVATDTEATLFVLGGEPFAEDIVMWWNFVARGHDEIVRAREDWESGSDRFGVVAGHDERIPAPPLPSVRLTPRRRQL